MPITYHQITEVQRMIIDDMLVGGFSQTAVAKAIGVNKSSISRERKRGLIGNSKRYFYLTGQQVRSRRRADAGAYRRKLFAYCLDFEAWPKRAEAAICMAAGVMPNV